MASVTTGDGTDPFATVRAALADYGPPVVVFNKSHSGSRLLARLLSRAGLFIGAERNASEDALSLVPVVERLVVSFYPDYRPLFLRRDESLDALIVEAFQRHLTRWPGGCWGWKLGETAYVLPIVHAIFPEARYVHLIRDGRDVAFSNHVAPRTLFWRKVYFNTAAIRRWRGLPLSTLSYRFLPTVFNARHWANSVTVGRMAGSMMGGRYLEVRYEDLTGDFLNTATALLQAIDLTGDPTSLAEMAREVSTSQVGKHRRHSAFLRWLAMRELEPTLTAFGYSENKRDERSGLSRLR